MNVLVLVKSCEVLTNEILEIAGFEFCTNCYHCIVNLIDLLLDVDVQCFVEYPIPKSVTGSDQFVSKEIVEVKSKRHTHDALRCGHQVSVPMQSLNRLLVVAWAVQREHTIPRRQRI